MFGFPSYEVLSILAKAVGGPEALGALLLAAGAGIDQIARRVLTQVLPRLPWHQRHPLLTVGGSIAIIGLIAAIADNEQAVFSFFENQARRGRLTRTKAKEILDRLFRGRPMKEGLS